MIVGTAAAQQNPALKVTDSKAISVSLTKTHRHAQKHAELTMLMYLVSLFLMLQQNIQSHSSFRQTTTHN